MSLYESSVGPSIVMWLSSYTYTSRPRPRWPASEAASWLTPFLEASVTGDREHAVVADLRAEPLAEVRLGERDADTVREALAERPRRDLDAGGVAVLRVPGCTRPPLPELLEVGELEAVAGEVEHRVQEHRRVPGGQHEAIAVGPVRAPSRRSAAVA